MTHWAAQYIGRPWEAGSQGPDAFDCFGFFRHVQREHYGIEVEPVKVNADSLLDTMRAFGSDSPYKGWVQVDRPQDGDAIIMSQARHPSHIGTWIEIGRHCGAIHCVFGLGVVFSTNSALRVAGWGGISYWRFEKWA